MTTLLSKRHPLNQLTSSFFESRFPGLLDFNGGISDIDWNASMPEANVVENEKDYRIELATPGYEKKDFKVEVKEGMLTVSAERKNENKEEKKNYKRREFMYSSFSRSFAVPENSLTDKIDAKYENGILHLTLPKKEVTVSKAKEIKIS